MLKHKNKIKKFFTAFTVVLVELGLMVAATAAFISVFNYVDAKRVKIPVSENSAVSAISAPVSSAAESASSTPSSAIAASQVRQWEDWKLVLVNYDNKMPDDYQHTIVHEFDVDIDSRIVEPYREMHDAALKDGIKLWISSAYRSPEKQGKLFEQEIQNYAKTGLDYVDAVAKAEKSVARAGYSEHNSGLAIDLNGVLENFGGTPASNWLQKHAAEYGFVMRYPQDKQEITQIKYEPWHYRYVGVENAKKMNTMHMCLEEYIDYLKKNPTLGN